MIEKLVDQEDFRIFHTPGVILFDVFSPRGGRTSVSYHGLGHEEAIRAVMFSTKRLYEIGMGYIHLSYTPACEVLGFLIGERIQVVALASGPLVTTKVAREGMLSAFQFVKDNTLYTVVARDCRQGQVQVINILEEPHGQVYEDT